MDRRDIEADGGDIEVARGVLRRRGLLGGIRAMFKQMGGFLRQIKGRLRRTRGCGVELEVFLLTKGVVTDGRGEIFLYKGQNPSFSLLFYFERPNHLLLTNCRHAGCLGRGWIPLRIRIS